MKSSVDEIPHTLQSLLLSRSQRTNELWTDLVQHVSTLDVKFAAILITLGMFYKTNVELDSLRPLLFNSGL